jgi:hypothetical protein
MTVSMLKPRQNSYWWRMHHTHRVPSRAAAYHHRVRAGQDHAPAVAHVTTTPDGLTSRLVTTGGLLQRRPRACGHMIEGETTADHPISVLRPEETR